MPCSLLLLFLALVVPAFAQDNYEVQVYGSDTMAPGRTMLEFHTNLTISGAKDKVGSLLPTQHAVHETIEITHGFNNWFETGFYIFTSVNPGYGWQWVGDHIRPRVRAPASWNWPVGASLSMEFGYQRAAFSADTWSWEIRPIIDKQMGRTYVSFNPTLERSFHGPGISQGVTFSPNVKVGVDLNKRVRAGMEYYGGFGPVFGFDRFGEQGQMFLPALDLNFGPDWEFNVGVGVGVTHATDHLLVKMIVGRRFTFGHGRSHRE